MDAPEKAADPIENPQNEMLNLAKIQATLLTNIAQRAKWSQVKMAKPQASGIVRGAVDAKDVLGSSVLKQEQPKERVQQVPAAMLSVICESK